MTKPLLIWQPDIFPEKEKEVAAKYFIVEDYDVFDRHQYDSRGPFSMRGAVATATRLGLNISKYDCQKFVPYLADYMISRHFSWATAKQLTEYQDWA